MCRVSVIIPAYNVAPYIREAIASALSQTLTDFELVVVDDGSTDRTAEIVRAVDDPRIRLVQQTNQGSGAARNRGLAETTAPYVSFLDGDDLWLPGKLEAQAEWLDRHPETDLVFGRSQVIHEDGTVAGRALFGRPGPASVENMLVEDVIGNGSCQMLRRQAIEQAGHFDTTLQASVDGDLWLRVALLRKNNVFGLDQLVTLYRRRAGQISGNWCLKYDQWHKLWDKIERIAPDHAKKARPKAVANQGRVVSSVAYENGEYRDACRLMWRALRNAPLWILSDRRSWLQMAALSSSQILPRRLHQRLDRFAQDSRAKFLGSPARSTGT